MSADEDLAALYSYCFAFVYPSLYEGFGLPVLEAMSCGAPAVVSRSTSLPEVAGDAGFYIDPSSVDSLRSQMGRLSEHRELRESWRQASRDQAAHFSWAQAARAALLAYEKACSREPWHVTERKNPA